MLVVVLPISIMILIRFPKTFRTISQFIYKKKKTTETKFNLLKLFIHFDVDSFGNLFLYYNFAPASLTKILLGSPFKSF